MFMLSFSFCDSMHVVFLSGRESVQVLVSFVYTCMCINVGDPVFKGEGLEFH